MILVSVLVSIVAAEGVVRFINGQPLFAFPLPDPVGTATVKAEQLDGIPRAAGVDRAWFFSDPPPLPNRAEPPKGWTELFNYLQAHPSDTNEFQPNDVFKAWNSA